MSSDSSDVREIDTTKQIDYPGINNYSQFSYDGLDRNTKIVETVSGSVTTTKQFIWSSVGRCEERDVAGTQINRFFERGQAIGSTKYFYQKDHLNSIRSMTDNSSVIQSEFQFDPFGRISKLSSTVVPDFGYAGYYSHERSGLALTLARPYNAIFGKFISRDPIEEEGGLNLYAYVLNNPEFMTDPSGLCQCKIDWDKVRDAVNQGTMMGMAAGAAGGGMAGGLMGSPTGPGAVVTAAGGAVMGAAGLGGIGGIAGGMGEIAGQLINQMGSNQSNDSGGGFQKNPQGDNSAANNAAKDALKQACKDRGMNWSNDLQGKFHKWITGQGYGKDQLAGAADDFLERCCPGL